MIQMAKQRQIKRRLMRLIMGAQFDDIVPHAVPLVMTVAAGN